MRVNIAGAGSAGLYAAILIRRARPDIEISIFEQNTSDATFGFGVVFSDQALGFLREDDPETVALIEPHMQRWPDMEVVHKGERISIDGVGFAAIGRLDLLQLLQQRAAQLGINPVYECRLETMDALGEADLIIGADGLNSIVRASSPEEFGERIETLSNRFIWYGAMREFDALTQSFVETRLGKFNAHHYRYQPGRSTFIIETTDAIWRKAGFAELDAETTRTVCEELFDDVLGGSRLVDNNSNWRQFPNLICERYFAGNKVLVGDALHTAHFSIGSGTRLALEDVASLVSALKSTGWDVPAGLAMFQDVRKPALQKIIKAATRSAFWYEAFDQHMALEPLQFALGYIQRAGRLDADKLRRFAPGFAAELEASGISLSI